MQQPNNKKLSSKPSIKNLKSKNHSLKNKDYLIVSARTPRPAQFKVDLKKRSLDRFNTIKSIPTITYRDIESTLLPCQTSENQQNLCYLNHTEQKLESETELPKTNKIKRLLSDRRIQKSDFQDKLKQSPFLKVKHDDKTKKKKQNLKKEKSKLRRNTTINIGNFQQEDFPQSKPKLENLLKRTNQLLYKYRAREELWKKQRQELIKQLEKHRKKTNGKMISTSISNHNNHSHKLLI